MSPLVATATILPAYRCMRKYAPTTGCHGGGIAKRCRGEGRHRLAKEERDTEEARRAWESQSLIDRPKPIRAIRGQEVTAIVMAT
jgi:hypothetical protein